MRVYLIIKNKIIIEVKALNSILSKHIASAVTLPRGFSGGSPPCAGTGNPVESHPFSLAKGLDDIIWRLPVPGISQVQMIHP